MSMKRLLPWLLLTRLALAQPPSQVWVRSQLAPLRELYQRLHAHPELSFKEFQTQALVMGQLKALGAEVEPLGGTGLVGFLRNGSGPTVMIRTDLDGLPIEEKTGLSFSSQQPGVMHACGHDLHMTVFLGVARYLNEHRDRWSGTVMLVGEPAEELGEGAEKLLAEGLFQKYPRPQAALAFHVDPNLDAGSVGYRGGYLTACADLVKITMRGRGGHGATPHLTIDPVAQAARLVVDLPTIQSREVSALEPVVITVGMIHGGTKSSIVPDHCELQMTVRTLAPETRSLVLASIERRARAVAAGAGAPEPLIELDPLPTPALYNDPKLLQRLLPGLLKTLGDSQVKECQPGMIAEDFSQYGRAGVPSCMFLLGSTESGRLQQVRQQKSQLSLHSASFYPDFESTLVTGVTTMSEMVVDLLAPAGRPGSPGRSAPGSF